MTDYNISIPDMVPEATRDVMVYDINKWIDNKVIALYALSKTGVTGFKLDPVETQGKAIISFSIASKAYSKRVLTRIYQGGLFNNWLALHISETEITLITDGILNLTDLRTALDEAI